MIEFKKKLVNRCPDLNFILAYVLQSVSVSPDLREVTEKAMTWMQCFACLHPKRTTCPW